MVRAQIGSSDRKIVLLRKALRNETDERGYTVLTGVPAEEFRNPPPSKLVNPPLVEWQMAV